jgi:sodium transport system permease protein
MHLIPQQVFNAGLLGLVLGLIALRTRSILPGILFHFVYNSLGVLADRVPRGVLDGHIQLNWLDRGPARLFLSMTDGHVDYHWPTLVIGAVIACLLLRHLLIGFGTKSRPVEMRPQEEMDIMEQREHADQPPVGVG